MNTSLPLIEGAEGITLLSNWLIVLREDFDFAQSALAGHATNQRRAYQLLLAETHETIHFLQGFTTAFPYSYSFNLLNLCNRLMASSRSGGLDAHTLSALRQDYTTLRKLFDSPHEGISTVDLMEAMAVTESFRALSPSVDPTSFGEYLSATFPDRTSRYRKVLTIIGDKFGLDTALDIASRICFLALNGTAQRQIFGSTSTVSRP